MTNLIHTCFILQYVYYNRLHVSGRRERVQAKVQRLKTGPIQLREHTPTEKHSGSRGIKVAAPPLDSPCDGPVTYPGDIKYS